MIPRGKKIKFCYASYETGIFFLDFYKFLDKQISQGWYNPIVYLEGEVGEVEWPAKSGRGGGGALSPSAGAGSTNGYSDRYCRT